MRKEHGVDVVDVALGFGSQVLQLTAVGLGNCGVPRQQISHLQLLLFGVFSWSFFPRFMPLCCRRLFQDAGNVGQGLVHNRAVLVGGVLHLQGLQGGKEMLQPGG